jgi:hypothetical protein
MVIYFFAKFILTKRGKPPKMIFQLDIFWGSLGYFNWIFQHDLAWLKR